MATIFEFICYHVHVAGWLWKWLKWAIGSTSAAGPSAWHVWKSPDNVNIRWNRDLSGKKVMEFSVRKILDGPPPGLLDCYWDCFKHPGVWQPYWPDDGIISVFDQGSIMNRLYWHKAAGGIPLFYSICMGTKGCHGWSDRNDLPPLAHVLSHSGMVMRACGRGLGAKDRSR